MTGLFLFSRNRLSYFCNNTNTPAVKINCFTPLTYIFSKLLYMPLTLFFKKSCIFDIYKKRRDDK